MQISNFPEKVLLPYEDICAAVKGDPEALMAVLRHFAHYISAKSARTFYDENGRPYQDIDQELKQRIESKLIIQIVQKFRPE